MLKKVFTLFQLHISFFDPYFNVQRREFTHYLCFNPYHNVRKENLLFQSCIRCCTDEKLPTIILVQLNFSLYGRRRRRRRLPMVLKLHFPSINFQRGWSAFAKIQSLRKEDIILKFNDVKPCFLNLKCWPVSN